MKNFPRFVFDGLRATLCGGRTYWCWVGLLLALFAVGLWNYAVQIDRGLVITGMSDQVSWGFYIANFAFFVGIAAAAVLLVIPAYVFHREDVKGVVLLGEGMAVAAVMTAILFVVVDIGHPERAWHVIPGLGRFNFPSSMLAWDILVLNGYLALNLFIPMYVLYEHYQGREPDPKRYLPFVVVAMFWAISIHTVTAFLFSSSVARPYWNISLLAPRFIASAFASGPALIIIALQTVRRFGGYPVGRGVIETLALIMAVAMQINVFFVGAELFTDFYFENAHAGSMRYLYLGLEGLSRLTPFIWIALAMNLVSVTILSIHPLRHRPALLNAACVLGFFGIWIEKGMGLVVPGFVPTPLGEVFEYAPTLREILISVGIWAFGVLLFTLCAKAGLAIELDRRQAQTPRAL